VASWAAGRGEARRKEIEIEQRKSGKNFTSEKDI
jgi:hypothetical protein